jgi:hypothetical protein
MPRIRIIREHPSRERIFLKDLEAENARLKRAVAELTLDKLILKEAAEGNW